VLHIEPDFFPGFMEAAGVFGIGEVLTESTERSCVWEKQMGSVFNYAMYYAMTRAFAAPGTSMDGIIYAINSTNLNCDDSTTMGSFSEVSLLLLEKQDPENMLT
jgi:alpha-amylase